MAACSGGSEAEDNDLDGLSNTGGDTTVTAEGSGGVNSTAPSGGAPASGGNAAAGDSHAAGGHDATGGGESAGGSEATGGGESAGGSGATGGSSAIGVGEACDDSSDCQSELCDDGVCLDKVPGCSIDDVANSPADNWTDSYSVDGRCYCATTFDHAIGEYLVETPAGMKTVQDVCEALGPGPGIEGNPVYNDIQCGNGPANDAGDEDYCPGRVDQGDDGCCTRGPEWDLSVFED